MKHLLRVRSGLVGANLEVEEGRSVAEALRADGRFAVEAPCGGAGLCGKCRITARGDGLSEPDEVESRALSAAELAAGARLACRSRLVGDASIELLDRGAASIVAAGPDSAYALDPPVRRAILRPREASLEDQADDETRLLDALARAAADAGGKAEGAQEDGAGRERPARVALSALAGLALSARGGEIEAVIAGGEVLSVSRHRPGSRALGVGVDIGTTTVLCRLVDLDSGEALGTLSELNSQRDYGADVLSRIAASEEEGGLESLRSRITSQIARMVAALAEGVAGEKGAGSVASIAVAGNTTMLHLLAGVPPGAMARSPFAPAFLGRRVESAAALGLVSHPGCAAILLPGVSAYVGADIVAGMAAIGLHEAPGRSLYLDLGTNGEIGFGGREGILCCATAAGPAFEGAGIEQGSAGFEGAVDSVWLEDGKLRYGTIGGKTAIGICGSGLIDALAAFLDLGLLDETGRVDEAVGERMYLDEGLGIYLSQADVRAAQLAKAAIAAGIDSLLGLAGCGFGEVDRLYLAGGFGSLLGLRGATRIGLLPAELADRVVVVGNAAGAGATAACLSRAGLEACSRVASICRYVELSGRADFNAAYVERMMFPERG